MDYMPDELAKMSDNTFKALFQSHVCGKPYCAIGRESFNRPRYENKGRVKVRDYSNVPPSSGLNERLRAI